jgi:Ion channel
VYFANFDSEKLIQLTAQCRQAGTFDFATAFYFSSVLFSTVGFGDMVPCSSGARTLASIQMLLASIHAMVFFGVLVKYGMNKKAAH